MERATIIVADLTHERPNCYLEVGYAMGLGKRTNLILTVREDHHHRSQHYRVDGPRVHFDLEGYDLLLWDEDDLDGMRTELGRRIKRRLAILQPPVLLKPDGTPHERAVVVDTEWIEAQRDLARRGLATIERGAGMEASVAISPKGSWRQTRLLAAVEQSQITTFGWPIGVVLNRAPWRPRPTAEGVLAEVAIGNDDEQMNRASYDYWYLRQTGDFYLLQSLFEDERRPGSLFFDTRIVRTTELLLFLSRVYARLDVSPSTFVRVDLSHHGLRGRELRAATNRRVWTPRTTDEDTITATIECTVGDLETKLVEQVKGLLEPLFTVFEFFEISDQVWTEIVDNFVAGRIS